MTARAFRYALLSMASVIALSGAMLQAPLAATSDIIHRAQTLAARTDGQSLLDYARLLRTGVPVNDTNPLLVPNFEAAHAALEKALTLSGAHLAPTQVTLAKMLLNGEGGQVDFDRAISLLDDAAAAGNTEALFILGEQLLQVPGREQEAVADFQTALRFGYGAAGLDLSQYYSESDASQSQSLLQLSMALLEQQANEGSGSAASALGEFYRTGPSELWQHQRAIDWYETAFANGDERALFWMAKLQADPSSPVFNNEEAARLYVQAAERGSIDAAIEIVRNFAEGGPVTFAKGEADRWIKLLLQTNDTKAQLIFAKELGGSGNERQVFADDLYKKLMAENVPEIDGLLQLGEQFRDGDGIRANVGRALDLFQRGAERNSKDGTVRFAELLLVHPELQTPENIGRAFAKINDIAEAGSISGAVILGNMYVQGFGTKVDRVAAAKWYQRAADSGNSVDGMTSLANLYLADPTPQVRGQALTWLKRAAGLGSLDSQIMLAKIYADGDIVGRDVFAAIDYYQNAVQGHAGGALRGLVALYLKIGGDAATGLARTAFQDAIASGYPDAEVQFGAFLLSIGAGSEAIAYLEKPQYNRRPDVALMLYALYSGGVDGKVDLARAYSWLDRAVANISEQPTAEADVAMALVSSTSATYQTRGLEMLEELRAGGDGVAARMLARTRLAGIGGPIDVPAAVTLYQQAIGRGDLTAKLELGDIYQDAALPMADTAKALALYQEVLSSDPQNAAANLRMGNAYADGLIGAPDLTAAAPYFQAAARSGNASAQHALGVQYYWGTGVAQDANNAATWLKASANGGEIQAFADLATLRNSGIGTHVVPAEAFSYAYQAAVREYVPAMIDVGIALVQGFGVPADAAAGTGWLERAADLGSNDAMYRLYLLYRDGLGVPASADEASKWLDMAANSGSGSALFQQALDLQALGTPEGAAEAVVDLKKAAALNHNQSKKFLVKMGLMSASDANDDEGDPETTDLAGANNDA